jgi:fructose-specific phosphotransferase system IIA component
MLLRELLEEDFIIMEIKSKNKKEIIEELVEILVKNGVVTDEKEFLYLINEREKLESTGIGEGIAIPHVHSKCVKELKVVLGKSSRGVDFNSLDGKPVYLIFMIASPSDEIKSYFQTLARISRLLKSKVMKKALLEANSKTEVMEIISDFDHIIPERLEVKKKKGRVIYKNKK